METQTEGLQTVPKEEWAEIFRIAANRARRDLGRRLQADSVRKVEEIIRSNIANKLNRTEESQNNLEHNQRQQRTRGDPPSPARPPASGPVMQNGCVVVTAQVHRAITFSPPARSTAPKPIIHVLETSIPEQQYHNGGSRKINNTPPTGKCQRPPRAVSRHHYPQLAPKIQFDHNETILTQKETSTDQDQQGRLRITASRTSTPQKGSLPAVTPTENSPTGSRSPQLLLGPTGAKRPHSRTK